MIRKPIKLLFLLLITIIINSKIYAETDVNISYNHNYNWTGNGSSETGPPEPNGKYTVTKNSHNYECKYYYSTQASTRVTIDSYNLNSESKMSGSTIIDDTFKAGTWIGLRNEEIKTVTWNIDKDSLKCYEIVYDFTCVYEKTTTGTYNTTTYPKFYNIGDKFACQSICEGNNYEFNNYNLDLELCKCKKTTSNPTITTKKIYDPHYDEPSNECPTPKEQNIKFLEKIDETKKNKRVYDQTLLNETHEDAKRKAKNEAIAKIGYPISTVEYLMEKTNGTLETKELSSTPKQGYDPYKVISDNDWSGELQKKFEFKPNKICLNVLKGTIQYKENGNCNNTEELDVTSGRGKDNNEYWRYFIPLTSTTGTNFYIRLGKNNENTKLSKEECASVMEEHPLEDDYLHYIITLNNEQFEGIQSKDKKTIKNAGGCKNKKTGNYISEDKCLEIMEKHQMHNDYTHYIKSLNEEIIFTDKKANESYNITDIKNRNGCRFSVTINYNVEQKFYGEEKKSGYTSLKGYGMYFRQIDINNPFPTDLANSIYWNGLYDKSQNQINLEVATDSKPKTIKLETGFNNPTYVAKITNKAVTKIKSFNSKHSYTSWTGINESDTEGGMNANGKSNFVRKSGIITTKQSSFYNLGCGPTNANWVGCGNS